MHPLIAATLGTLFNFYRGGPLHNRDEIIGRLNPQWLRATVHFLAQGDTVNALAFAAFCAYLYGHSGPVFAMTAVMMLRGSTPGWGKYIGAAGGWETTDLAEVPYIDKIIKRFVSNPRWWGIFGLSLRCGEWGLFIGAPLVGYIGWHAFMPMLAGLCAGPIVYVLSKILPHKLVWPAFECVLGAILWVSCI